MAIQRIPPLDFSIKEPDLIQKALSGLQLGQAIRGVGERSEAKEAAEALKIQYKKDVETAFKTPTPEAFASLITKYPQQREAFKQSFDLLDTERKDNEIQAAMKVYSALSSGNTDVADKILGDRITAVENVGGDSSKLKKTREFMRADPKGAEGYALLVLSSVMGEEDFSKNFKALAEARGGAEPKFRVLSSDEKKKLGFDSASPLQIASNGKISQIGGKGVTVTIEGDKKPSFGTIPPGWQVIEEDGVFRMEPIPGGPAETKAKVLAKKKQKQSQLTKRAGNVVFQDINRLEEKIKTSSFFSPVTGISGFLASFVPGTRRVDAEKLKETIVANIGFDRLQQMREASPTGGALGAISERELSTLQAVMGNLAFVQSEEQLLTNLDRIDTIYKDILEKASGYPNADEFGFSKQEEKTVTESRTTEDGRTIVKFSDGTFGVQ